MKYYLLEILGQRKWIREYICGVGSSHLSVTASWWESDAAWIIMKLTGFKLKVQSTNQDWLKFVAWDWYNIANQAGMWYLCTIVKFHQLTILLYLQYFAPPHTYLAIRKKVWILFVWTLFVGKLRAVYKSRTGDFDGGAFWQKFSSARAGKAFIANEMWKIFTNYTTQSKRTAKYSKGGLL